MKVKKSSKKKHNKTVVRIVSALIAIIVLCSGIILSENTDIEHTITPFVDIGENNIYFYPEKLKKLFENNKEAKEFVLSYYEKKDIDFEIDLSVHLSKDEIPLFMQWDERWGYKEYAGNLMGLSGCGPTCLSMVAFHLTQNEKYTPLYMAEFSQKNGYYESGNGTLWTLFTEGAVKLGFTVEEVPLWESAIIKQLENDKPIICNVGKGVFTESGHYIVLTKYQNGKIYVNDPNRKANSKGWNLDDFSDQIKNMWAISI